MKCWEQVRIRTLAFPLESQMALKYKSIAHCKIDQRASCDCGRVRHQVLHVQDPGEQLHQGYITQN
jgi:hypothetical protein